MGRYQLSQIQAAQSGATGNGNGNTIDATGANGAVNVLVSNGNGTATLTVYGYFTDPATANVQDGLVCGVFKATDSGAGTNTARTVASGAISVAANTSYLYCVSDAFPYYRAVISSASGLGAGTNVTGLTATFYLVAA